MRAAGKEKLSKEGRWQQGSNGGRGTCIEGRGGRCVRWTHHIMRPPRQRLASQGQAWMEGSSLRPGAQSSCSDFTTKPPTKSAAATVPLPSASV